MKINSPTAKISWTTDVVIVLTFVRYGDGIKSVSDVAVFNENITVACAVRRLQVPAVVVGRGRSPLSFPGGSRLQLVWRPLLQR